MHNRGRTPRLFVKPAPNEPWVQFVGRSLPGALVIVSSRYKKDGKWSETKYDFAVASTTVVVEVLQPFDSFGNTWADHGSAITLLHGEYERECAAREILPLIDSPSYREAVARAEENEQMLATLT
jgi:hypothetical protein